MDLMKSVLLLMGLWLAAEAYQKCESSDDCSSEDCCVKLFRQYASLRSPRACRPRSVYEPRGECRDDSASTAQRGCRTDSNCPSGYCCRVEPQVRGRKRRQLQSGGECTPSTPAGGTCYASLITNPPQGQHFRCPCQSGLTCQSINITEIPVGVLGQCV